MLLRDIRQTFWQKIRSLVLLIAELRKFSQKGHYYHVTKPIINRIYIFYENSPKYIILSLE